MELPSDIIQLILRYIDPDDDIRTLFVLTLVSKAWRQALKICLTEINLSNYSDTVNARTIRYLGREFSCIKTLVLRGCKHMGSTKNLLKFATITKLDISKTNQQLTASMQYIGRLRTLECLNLAYAKFSPTKKGLHNIVKPSIS